MKERKWGDGGGNRAGHDPLDDKQHVITDISVIKREISCRCGVSLSGSAATSVDDLWAVHLGREYHPAIYRAGQLATDHEVHEFIGKLADPFFTAPALKAQSYTPRVSNGERARDALIMIMELGDKCTCPPGRVSRDCPNFQEGDDDE